MAYGIHWYTGVGEHDYEVTRSATFETLSEALEALVAVAKTFASEEMLFTALEGGPEETVYWLTDDLGFEFFRP